MVKVFIYEYQNVSKWWYTTDRYTSLRKILKRLNQYPDLMTHTFNMADCKKSLENWLPYEFTVNAEYEKDINGYGTGEHYWKETTHRICKQELT